MSRTTAALLIALAPLLAAGPGCRSFQGNFLRRDVAQAPSSQPEQPDPEEIVRLVALEHDRRAELVRSLRVSDLNIVVDTFHDKSGQERSPFFGGTAAGVLVMERPRNLKIDLRKAGAPVADIGSNDREFWFANDLVNEMIVGQYAQTEGYADPLLASLRPEWIFEILGFEPLPEPGEPGVEIVPGESDALFTLVEQRRLGNGATMVKESVISIVEQRIVEHRLYTEDRRELIAGARIGKTQQIPVGTAVGTDPPATVELPQEILVTIPEVAQLKMRLGRQITLNPTDDFAARTTFERPEKRGYQVVDIMTLASAPGVSLAQGGPAAAEAPDSPPSPPTSPRTGPTTRESEPGALILPRSDGSVARTEEVSLQPDPRAESGIASPITLDLPTPSGAPSAEIRRSTWDSVDGNRFRLGVMGRE